MSVEFLQNKNGLICLFDAVIALEDKDEPEGIASTEILCSNSRSNYSETEINFCCDRYDPFKRSIYVYEIESFEEKTYIGAIPSELVESIKQRAAVPDSYFKIETVSYADIHVQYFCKMDDIINRKVFLNIGDNISVGKYFLNGYSKPKSPVVWQATSVKYNTNSNTIDVRLISKDILKLCSPENIYLEDYDNHVVSICLDELAANMFDESDYKYMKEFYSPIFTWEYNDVGPDNNPIITYCENNGRISFFSKPSFVRLPTIGDITISRRNFPYLKNEVVSYLLMPQISSTLLSYGDAPNVHQDTWFVNDVSFRRGAPKPNDRSIAIKNADRRRITPVFDIMPNNQYGIRPVIEITLPNLLK